MFVQRLTKTFAGRAAITLALLGAGYLLGVATGDASVHAGNRRKPADQQHFQSGAQRSEVLLREISEKLGTIDARLDRMEQMAKSFTSKRSPNMSEETR